MLVVENYPELKANQNFLAVQEELTGTENKIAFARQNYNDQVLFFNNKIQMFPSNIMAGMFGFSKRDFFEIEALLKSSFVLQQAIHAWLVLATDSGTGGIAM